MRQLIPPVCLFLALVALVSGFIVLAVPPPEPGMELHRARVEGAEEYRELLEERLEKRRIARYLVIGGLFGSAALLIAAAFATMGRSR